MKEKDDIRYKALSYLIKKLNCKFLGDFASGGEIMKNFLPKNIKYKSFDYPRFNLEKSFLIQEEIDCAISQEVIEHLRNPRIFLHSLNKSLKNKTKLILTIPNSSFIKYRLQFLLGKNPDTFMGPSVEISLFGKSYYKLSKKEKLSSDFMLHVRSYNFKEIKKMLELENFEVLKRFKLKYNGLKGFLLKMLPLNFSGYHFILAELKK